MSKNEQDKKGMLQEYYEAEAEKMKGQPFYVRHRVTLIMGVVWVVVAIGCILWAHYFPDGIF